MYSLISRQFKTSTKTNLQDQDSSKIPYLPWLHITLTICNWYCCSFLSTKQINYYTLKVSCFTSLTKLKMAPIDCEGM